MKFTVIVPTRERADVLGATLRTLVMQDHDHLDIVVSDNCSTDHTREVVAALNDPRVRYIRPRRRLSMSHHWEFVLSQVEEGWVAVIGDDDGLLPDAISTVADVARETGVQAVASRTCVYWWPGFSGNGHGVLKWREGGWNEVEMRDARAALSRVVRGEEEYASLPMLYTGGFVDISLVRAFRRRHGAFMHSQIPDLFSALAMAASLERFAFVNRPLALAGRSRHSTGRSFVEEARGGTRVAAMRKFVSEGNIPVHADIPAREDGGMLIFPPILVYESVLQLVDLGVLEESMRDHALALRRILALAAIRGRKGMRRQVEEWGEAFARRHGLDLARIHARATRPLSLWWRRGGDVLSALPSRLRRRKMRGSRHLPLSDVHQASIVMAARVHRALGGR